MVVEPTAGGGQPLRIALVGLGDAGAHHLRALSRLQSAGQAALVAVSSRDPSRARERLRELGHSPTVPHFLSLSDLLASGLSQAVILATPDGLHAEQVEQCADAAQHVLVEKPLALHSVAAQAAIAAAQRRGVVLRVGYQLRHHAGHQLLRAQHAAWTGPLHNLSVRWAWPDPATAGWRARGEGARFWSLAALGTHAIDLCQWLAQSPVVECRGLTLPPLGPDRTVDRCAEVSLAFASGVLAHISVAVTHRALSRLLLIGERGEVECLGTLGARGAGEIWRRPLQQPAEPVPFVPHDPYAAQLADFVQAVQQALGRRAADLTTSYAALASDDRALADALENVALLDRLAAGPADT